MHTLRAGPGGTGLAAARGAVASARAKLVQVQGPAAAIAARAAVSRAVADLAALNARSGPASASDIALARLKYNAAAARLAAARLALRHLTVRAPGTGTVNALMTAPGAPVDGTTAIAAITNLSRLAVRVELSEFDAARVKPRAASALVSVDALGGKQFPGKVLFEALTGVDTGGVVTFPVRVRAQAAHRGREARYERQRPHRRRPTAPMSCGFRLEAVAQTDGLKAPPSRS